MKSKIENVIRDLQDKRIIDLNEPDINMLKGTTEGLVYTLSENTVPKYVIKYDRPQEIEYVERFLQSCRNVSLLPEWLYTDPQKEFIVYSFITGTTHYNRGLKKDWMRTLAKEVLNHYKECHPEEAWGRLGQPRKSWHEFNSISAELAHEDLSGLLPEEDYFKVKSIVERINRSGKEKKYLLHGDTGVHNFVFNQRVLTGVIDPSPIIGPVIYDFTYAFCSSPDDLNIETLLSSFSLLENILMEKSQLIDEVVLQLYTRLGICVRVHPQDLEGYLRAWDYWKYLLSS
ncbi:phosphotransferase [Bacillus infantis]|uniref:phosphotransferase n=1 Tax=Bacillus infantis TaxID=324767 RepID=UPI002155E543|nr:phosphotransferase [Bacillus infantis]